MISPTDEAISRIIEHRPLLKGVQEEFKCGLSETSALSK